MTTDDSASNKMESAAADIDLQRQARCGFPEVIYGEGKTADLIVHIMKTQQAAGQACLATRVTEEQANVVRAAFPATIYNPVARTVRLVAPEATAGNFENPPTNAAIVRSTPGPTANASGTGSQKVLVVTAGSSDMPVAEEALETLRWMNVACELIADCGVAGPHRLQRHVARLQGASVIVCVAGMEAALPSVVGGFVSCPVIGVPTSVGYGASLQGVTAFLSMLTCCSSNVTVVNIDAGFKGGYVAGLIASRMQASAAPEN
ncbi:MAG: nickel pincer cofactor biosynthesis protein LarB [Planctomycetaceae bacterium]|nr:nickel pincer cofactor biosynthesis protein LarB [Planctomycetaceae bacterium]